MNTMTLDEKVLERYLSEEMPAADQIIREFNIPEFQFWDIVGKWTRANVWQYYGDGE